MKTLFLSLALTACAFGQTKLQNITADVVDFSASTSTKPHKSGLSSAIPATCSVGSTYFKTDAAAGFNLFACTATNTWTLLSNSDGAITYAADNNGTALTTGMTRCQASPFAGTITGWTILTDQSSSIQLGVWKLAFGSALPTSANSIVASAPPAITTAVTGTSTTLTGWTTSIAKNDMICGTITSVSSATWVALKLQVVKQ